MATVSPHRLWPDPSGWSYTLGLPHDPRAPRIARTTLRAVLGSYGMGELVDTAELLACELVTNAYRHSDGPASLKLRAMEGDRLRVSVWDTNPVIPAPFDKPPGLLPPVSPPESVGADRGRGLLLVQLCADNWGGYPLGGDLFGTSGKLLWFELGRQRSLAAVA
ncbi:ATP-binding protein [Streptomyces sp. A3M-1-3]|uniref:ATP-binding protein n=1 Tax=Streptomyces sp. A3M-1-3 TaxID=2962044 RepID=UPI0020B8C1AE|nr:ATP-binding protein [Streptomyces sp. A3M-1-3]MCP3819963.1 ATP-binding protein [Streptomyces sp. A3M-1-3]